MLSKQNKNSGRCGRPSRLTKSEKLLMILIYLRQYPTYLFLSLIFGVGKSIVHRTIDMGIDFLYSMMGPAINPTSEKERISYKVELLGKIVTWVIDGMLLKLFKIFYNNLS